MSTLNYWMPEYSSLKNGETNIVKIKEREYSISIKENISYKSEIIMLLYHHYCIRGYLQLEVIDHYFLGGYMNKNMKITI